jgi:DNA transformation protein
MAVQPQYLAYVLEQLAGLGEVRSRRMFGGVGLYYGELFFGLIDDDTLFLKTDESNSAEYIARNMPRFMPPSDRPVGPMGYHQVPADIIEDAEMLAGWARKSVGVALSSHAARVAIKKKSSVREKKPARRPMKEKAAAKKVAAKKPARRRTRPRKSR